MVDKIVVFRKIVPEIFEMLERRYRLLRTILFLAPVGRRALAQRLAIPERRVRNEIEVLREANLVTIDSAGMRITPEGEEVLNELKNYIREIYGLTELEKSLAQMLGIKKVIVVPGDSDSDEVVKKDLATATARFLRKVVKDHDILAVTGGSTLSEVANSFPTERIARNITVVPARGGLGEDVNLQANSIAANLANRLGGQYRLLHAPDNVEPDLIKTIVNEPRIRDVIELGKNAQVLLHGIGTVEEMARRRGLDQNQLNQILERGAVGEAFGYYFDAAGQIVYSTSSVGLRLEDLAKIPLVIAVGGGERKALAVLAVVSTGYCDVCITDEGAARRLMNLKTKGGRKNDN
jgi:central glycolytic genes regulator